MMSKFSNAIKIIKQSDLFDIEWYLDQYNDVKHLAMDPIQHYLRIGALLERDPGPKFSTSYYLENYPDVQYEGVNPLLHYLECGKHEGRNIRPNSLTTEIMGTRIDVIIPVFNALEDVKECLSSLLEKQEGFILRAIVVNDGSDDATTAFLRQKCSASAVFHLIEHKENRGYTKAANTGLRASDAPYVVILNSDTKVTKGWLKGLIRCMTSDPSMGIVGPLSNAASWQNVPELLGLDGTFAINRLSKDVTPDNMAAIIAAASRRSYPRIPFVNGFCFMIKREVLDAIGYMDEENFPTGYGEENDFCIRAADAGFTLAIADDSYVFHAKSKSFGHERRKELSKKGSENLKKKHSAAKYEKLVGLARNTAALDRVRKAVRQEMHRSLHVSGYFDFMSMNIMFLLPVHGGGGGAHSVVQEVSAMRRLGINARVAVQHEHRGNYLETYDDLAAAEDIFIGFGSCDILDIAYDFDIVVATIHSSAYTLQKISAAHPHILAAYYVQDYEPLFFAPGSDGWHSAFNSYSLVPEAVLFAKTDWIACKVHQEHGVVVNRVKPSIDHNVYRPAGRKYQNLVHVCAMIRPKTPRRGAERTMRVLSWLAAKYGDYLRVHLFGSDEQDVQFQRLTRNFGYKNHGVLKRRQVSELLAACDIFIDLSDYQAFGRTGLEAMASGCMAVLPLHGGADEYAIDGVNSLVVDTLNENDCFSQISDLLQMPDKIAKMRLAGLQKAAEYSTHSAAVSELTLLAGHFAQHRIKNPRRERRRLCLVPALTANKGTPRTPTGSGYVRLIYPYGATAVRGTWKVESRLTGDLPAPDAADLVVVQRDLENFEREFVDMWHKEFKAAGGKLVYELDDDLLDQQAVVSRGYKGDAAGLAKRVRWFVDHADMVITSTKPLAQHLRAINSQVPVHVVPNFLDGSLWRLDRPRDHKTGKFARSDDVVRVGFVGTSSHNEDLSLVRDAVKRIEAEYGARLQVEVIGAFQNNKPMFGKRIALPKISTYPNFVEWLHQRVHWDIAIIPLLDNSFNRSKSTLKFLECAALDAAIICSNVSTYDKVARHGENCLSVRNDTESWYNALKQLIENKKLRESLASEARSEALKYFTIEANCQIYLNVLDAPFSVDPDLPLEL